MGATAMMPETFEAWPRTPEEKFRICVLRDDQPCWVASATDPESLGLALVTLGREGEFADEVVGAYECNDDPAKPGLWLISPFTGRRWA